MKENDLVKHPNHYISSTGLECIDVIKAFTEGLDGFEAYATGNILKYACRWKKKNGVEDLKKLRQYTDELIAYVETDENNENESPTVWTLWDDYEGLVLCCVKKEVAEEITLRLNQLVFSIGYYDYRDICKHAKKISNHFDDCYDMLNKDIRLKNVKWTEVPKITEVKETIPPIYPPHFQIVFPIEDPKKGYLC